jgi:hypothetical protein
MVLKNLTFLIVLIGLVACGQSEKKDTRKSKPTPPEESGDDDDDRGDDGSDSPSDGGTSQVGDFVMGALGDSITKGLNAQDFLVESEDLSWSTGKKPTIEGGSHYSHFKKDLGLTSIKVVNAAKSAATAKGLSSQLQLLKGSNLDYATLLIGANDVCGFAKNYTTDLEAFKDQVQDTVDQLMVDHPNVKLLISSVPDMIHLHSIMKDKSSCQSIWDLVKHCELLASADPEIADRALFESMLKDVNNALGDIAQAAGPNAHFADGYSAKFEAKHVSTIDCFHPSAEGLAYLSNKTWDKDFAQSAIKP